MNSVINAVFILCIAQHTSSIVLFLMPPVWSLPHKVLFFYPTSSLVVTLWERACMVAFATVRDDCLNITGMLQIIASTCIPAIADIFHTQQHKPPNSKTINFNEPLISRAEQLPGLTWQSTRSVIVVCRCLLTSVTVLGDCHTKAARIFPCVSVDTCCLIERWSVTATWWAGLCRISWTAVTVPMDCFSHCFPPQNCVLLDVSGLIYRLSNISLTVHS